MRDWWACAGSQNLTREGVAGSLSLAARLAAAQVWEVTHAFVLPEILCPVYRRNSRRLQEGTPHFQKRANTLDAHPMGKLRGRMDPAPGED